MKDVPNNLFRSTFGVDKGKYLNMNRNSWCPHLSAHTPCIIYHFMHFTEIIWLSLPVYVIELSWLQGAWKPDAKSSSAPGTMVRGQNPGIYSFIGGGEPVVCVFHWIASLISMSGTMKAEVLQHLDGCSFLHP